MVLPSSGSLSVSQIRGEFGGSAPDSLSEYYGAAGGVPSSGAISISNFYGKSAFSASGGDSVYTSGSYRIHVFTNSGTFTCVNTSKTMDILVVAGGGAGGLDGYSGAHLGGGGGGGGIRYVSGVTLNGSYTVTVGGGGAATFYTSNTGNNGNDSAFGSYTATGGGGGGCGGGSATGATGGCGGGAGIQYGSGLTYALSGGSGTQGYGGGNTPGGNNPSGCGGGGGGGAAGGAGVAYFSGGQGGAGGTGASYDISGTAVYYGRWGWCSLRQWWCRRGQWRWRKWLPGGIRNQRLGEYGGRGRRRCQRWNRGVRYVWRVWYRHCSLPVPLIQRHASTSKYHSGPGEGSRKLSYCTRYSKPTPA